MLDDHPFLAVDEADDLEAHARDGPGGHRARGDLDVDVRGQDLVALDDLVESEPDRIGDEVQHRTPGERRRAGGEEQRLRRVRLPEAHDLEHGERVVPRRVVDDLHHPHRPDVAAQGEGVDRDAGVAEPGVDAGGVEGRPALAARGLEPVDHAGSGVGRVQEGDERGVHHVCTGGEDAAEIVDHAVGPQVGVGGVADDVGRPVEQGIGVLRGGHPERRAAAQLTGVAPGLVVAVHPQPDQLQRRMGGDRRSGVDPDGAGRPLDHGDGHAFPLRTASLDSDADPTDRRAAVSASAPTWVHHRSR